MHYNFTDRVTILHLRACVLQFARWHFKMLYRDEVVLQQFSLFLVVYKIPKIIFLTRLALLILFSRYASADRMPSQSTRRAVSAEILPWTASPRLGIARRRPVSSPPARGPLTPPQTPPPRLVERMRLRRRARCLCLWKGRRALRRGRIEEESAGWAVACFRTGSWQCERVNESNAMRSGL